MAKMKIGLSRHNFFWVGAENNCVNYTDFCAAIVSILCDSRDLFNSLTFVSPFYNYLVLQKRAEAASLEFKINNERNFRGIESFGEWSENRFPDLFMFGLLLDSLLEAYQELNEQEL